MQKRRGGWPKGRKRKPELQVTKPPKAPLTAYVLFLKERRKFYKETQPNLTFREVSKTENNKLTMLILSVSAATGTNQ